MFLLLLYKKVELNINFDLETLYLYSCNAYLIFNLIDNIASLSTIVVGGILLLITILVILAYILYTLQSTC